MGFGAAVKTCLSKYVTFSGRASRAEYWYFWLLVTLVHIAASILDAAVGTQHPTHNRFSSSGGYIDDLSGLALFLPLVSAQVRRLHDRDRSGWWFWLYLLPVIGWAWIIIWNTRLGTDGPNRFGPDPLALEENPPALPA